MIKINEVINDEAPRKKIESKFKSAPKFEDEVVLKSLMSPSQVSFLCGLMNATRPKKILEVGVAQGGTTAIVLQLLEDRNEPYELHSVDLGEKIGGKQIGFVATFAKENNLFGSSTVCDEYPLENNLFDNPPPVNFNR